jgi:energy-coupling factor transport system substrate-specific component
MISQNQMKNWVKYIIAFFTVLLFRLMPFRAPNVEPIMAVIMPFGKVYGALMSFIFGVLSIVIYDSVTSGFGVWTVLTALTYGLVGVGSFFYFKNKSGWKSYVLYAVTATIIYDALTGLTLGPLFFGQTFMTALVGQIPFTALHLLGNVSFAIVLSPAIERWLVKESKSVVSVEKVVLVS